MLLGSKRDAPETVFAASQVVVPLVGLSAFREPGAPQQDLTTSRAIERIICGSLEAPACHQRWRSCTSSNVVREVGVFLAIEHVGFTTRDLH